MAIFILLISLCSTLSAQTPTDSQLATYIQMLNLKPMQEVKLKNGPLYQLGLRLFYDRQLSGNDNISCHACHSLTGFSGDTLPLAVGEGAEGLAFNRQQMRGALIPRHTPALYNLGMDGVTALFWDGRIRHHPQGGWVTPEEGLNGPEPKLKEIATTLDSLLAAQALFPMTSPEEMLGQGSRMTRLEAWESIMDRLLNGRLGASYRRFFREAYPGVESFNIGHAANAIAELERHHFLANKTPYDLYLKGNKTILTERMKRGAILFMTKGQCTNCHVGEHLSSFGFQNIGVPQIGPGVNNGDDKGLMEVTKAEGHMYRFRVSPLRNIALTAPYMHTGVFKTMWEVIEHYNHPMRSLHHFSWQGKDPRYSEELKLDDNIDNMRARTRTLANNLPRFLNLSMDEKKDLYCFLMVGLTDIKFQADLIRKGVLDEMDDCSPRITQ
jgi:cytochrome c peroxidase